MNEQTTEGVWSDLVDFALQFKNTEIPVLGITESNSRILLKIYIIYIIYDMNWEESYVERVINHSSTVQQLRSQWV